MQDLASIKALKKFQSLRKGKYPSKSWDHFTGLIEELKVSIPEKREIPFEVVETEGNIAAGDERFNP